MRVTSTRPRPGHYDYRQFASLMRGLRAKLAPSERSLDAVAARAGLKRGQLYGFETVRSRARPVDRHTIEALAFLYRATEDEKRELLVAAGHAYVAPTLREEARSPVDDVLDAPGFSDADRREFVNDIRRFVERWQVLRRTREAQPRKAVVAAAGWQTHVFREDRFQRTLFPAINEAIRAGIEEILVVVGPMTPKLTLLDTTFKDKGLKIRHVLQERALGLGNVVMLAKEHIGEEPFALLLPDDVDESMTCLQRMLQLYRQVRKPIIAVAPLIRERPALLRNFGIAALANRPVLESSNRLFYIDGELSEKPSDPFVHALTHKIVGRYLFTPELFEALTDHNLTAAINRAWVKSKSNAICGYVVEQPLASIGRLKDIIADMDTKQIFDPEFYR